MEWFSACSFGLLRPPGSSAYKTSTSAFAFVKICPPPGRLKKNYIITSRPFYPPSNFQRNLSEMPRLPTSSRECCPDMYLSSQNTYFYLTDHMNGAEFSLMRYFLAVAKKNLYSRAGHLRHFWFLKIEST